LPECQELSFLTELSLTVLFLPQGPGPLFNTWVINLGGGLCAELSLFSLTREVVYARSCPSSLNPGGGLCAESPLSP